MCACACKARFWRYEVIKHCRYKGLVLVILLAVFLVYLTACSGGSVILTFDYNTSDIKTTTFKILPETYEIEFPSNPVRQGFVFEGWYRNEECSPDKAVDKKFIPSIDTTYYAKWRRSNVTATFIIEGGESVELSVPYNSSINFDDSRLPTIPDKEGFSKFWTINGVQIDEDDLSNLTSDIIVTNGYSQISYRVVYLVDYKIDNEASSDISFPGYYVYDFKKDITGSETIIPNNPIREGYEFIAWHDSKELNSVVAELPKEVSNKDLVFYAEFASSEDATNYLTYQKEDEGIRITGLTNLGRIQNTIVFPNLINNLPVEHIGFDDSNENLERNNVFFSNELENIILPSSVLSIGKFAFANSKNLKMVSTIYAENLAVIGKGAFAGCENLVSVNLNDSLTTIGSYAFAGLTTKQTETPVDLGSSFSDETWYEVDMKLKSITIDDTSPLSSIGYGFLYNTPQLKTFNIPQGFNITQEQKLDYNVFYGSSITNLTVASNHNSLISDANGAIIKDNTLIYYPIMGEDNPTFSVDFEVVGKEAFINNKSIKTLTLPSQVKKIEDYAFSKSGLTSFVLPTSLIDEDGENGLGDYAFSGCDDLASFSFGDSMINIISQYAFYDCKNLDNLFIPYQIKEIKTMAFSECDSLVNIEFEDTGEKGAMLKSIGSKAFFDSNKLGTFSLPSTVESIGDYAFASINDTMQVNLSSNLPSSLTNLGEYAFLNCVKISKITLPDNNGLTLGKGAFSKNTYLSAVSLTSKITSIPDEFFYGCTKISSITFRASLESIGKEAFYGCTSLEKLTFGKTGEGDSVVGIRHIADRAFYNCTSLKSGNGENAILPQTLLTLGEGVFAQCSSLTSIVIPEKLEVLSSETFANCSSLESVNYLGESRLTTIGDNSFLNCSAVKSISLPNTISARGDNLGFVKNPFFGCTELDSFEIEAGGDLTSKDGALYVGDKLYAYPTGKDSITLDDNITAIDDYACYGAQINHLDTKNVVTIGDYAFAYTPNLSVVVINEDIVNIKNNAFYNSNLSGELVFIATSNNNITIGASAFESTQLKEVEVVKNITSIGDRAFAKTHNLNKVTFTSYSDTTLSIGDYAFYESDAIKTINLPSQLTNIGDYAFSHCVSLESVHFADNNNDITIGEYAFSNCHYLENIEFLTSLVSIGEGALSYNTRLENVIFSNTANSNGYLELPDKLFYMSTNFKSFVLPDYVTVLGQNIFEGTNLEKIDINADCLLEEIKSRAFFGLSNLREFSFPDSLSIISDYAFSKSGIVEVVTNISNEVSIGESAFKDSTSLTFVKFNGTQVGASSFENTTNLKEVLILANKIDVMDRAFYNSSLEKLKLIANDNFINLEFGYIGAESFYNCKNLDLELDSDILITTEIGDMAFYGFEKLPNSLTVKSTEDLLLGEYVFANTNFEELHFDIAQMGTFAKFSLGKINNLVEITIDSAFLTIESGFSKDSNNISEIVVTAVSGYSTRENVLYKGDTLIYYPADRFGSSFEIPADITSLGEYAFADVKRLSSIVIGAKGDNFDEVLEKENNSFDGVFDNITFFVPEDMLDSYKTNWSTNNVEVASTELNGLVIKNINGNNYAVTQYIGEETDLIILQSYGDYLITEIGDHAFYNNGNIQSIFLPSSLRVIGKYAFSKMSNLESIYLGTQTKVIGEYAFAGNNFDTIVFNDLLVEIASYAFADCSNITSIDLPDTVEVIGQGAFYNCDSLVDVDLGISLKTLGSFAFADSDSLADINIPDTIENMGTYLFSDCDSFTYISVNTNFVPKLGANAFDNTLSALRIFVKEELSLAFSIDSNWKKYKEKILSVESLIEVDGNILAVEKIIGNNYSLISYRSAMKQINIPYDLGDGRYLTAIGRDSINHFVKEVTISEGVLEISERAFASALNLEKITLADSINTIGASAFRDLPNLVEVKFGDASTLTTIGKYAFYNAENLSNFKFPSNITTIDDYAFSGEDMNLNSITFTSEEDHLIKYIGAYAFANNSELEVIEFFSDVKVFGEGTFSNCVALKRFAFDSIGNELMHHEVTKLNGDKTKLFENANNLSIIVFDNLFGSYIKDWSVYSDRITTLDNINVDDFVYTLNESSKTATIVNYLGNDTDIVIPKTINDIYRVTKIDKYVFGNNVHTVKIPISVYEIGSYAFSGAKNLTKVEFVPDSSISYGDRTSVISVGAFKDCTQLNNFIVPQSVIFIGIEAFAGCSALNNLIFEDRVFDYQPTEIGDRAFFNCGFENFILPHYVGLIGSYSFSMDSLKTFEYENTAEKPATIKEIKSYAFYKTQLVSMEFPKCVTTVGNNAFDSCKKLQYISIDRTIFDGDLTVSGGNLFNNSNNCFIKVYVPDEAYESYSTLETWNTPKTENTLLSILATENASISTVVPNLKDDFNKFSYIKNPDLNSVTLTGHFENEEVLQVPNYITINGVDMKVTALNSFFDNKVSKLSFEENSTITQLSDYSFAKSRNLVSVILADSIIDVGDYSFASCSNLIKVKLSTNKHFEYIEKGAFANCTALEEITLPSNIVKIRESAFNNCSSLNRLIVDFVTPTALEPNALNGTNSHLAIIVNDNSRELFRNEWRAYEDKIFSKTNLYGDYIIREISGGWHLIQYNGRQKEINIQELIINDKKIITIAEDAIVHDTIVIE